MESFKLQKASNIKNITPKQLLFISIIVVVMILSFMIMASDNTTDTPVTQVENTRSTAEAQKELDRVIDLGKQAKLITSYEFSDSASVVYVTNIWYSQTVTFKKDLVAKIGMLKKEIKGYGHFEVRNYQSNEKVAELTSFTSSIEIYK